MTLKQTILALGLLIPNLSVVAQTPHPERIYLSGTGIDNTKTWEFYCSAGQNSGKKGKIQVPCNWELQGYGDYTYGRWYVNEGETPSKEVGTYRYTFKADNAWKGKQVKIYFDGVMTDTQVKINGQSAGDVHQGGFYRFSYDISSLLQYGKKNELVVEVNKHSANESINAAERKADWWLYGGIYRPVWLEVNPEVRIDFDTYLIDARADGSVKVRANVQNDEAFSGYEMRVTLREMKGNGSYTFNKTGLKSDKQGGTQLVELKGTFNGAKTWDPEHPNLYVATVELINDKGETIQKRENRIGFRTVEFIPQEGLYLNGVKLVMKGVNRHSFSVDGGRATSAAMSRQDALLIKEMNMNAVRSHYSPDEHFLDMCDSLGIVYLDELAGWQNGYDNVGRNLLEEMIKRDVNHTCIVLWDNGNEGGWNYDRDNEFAKWDALQKRHVIHPWADFNDLDTHHYPAYLTGVARFNNGYKVFMPTEFMHAMYDQGGGAGLRDFWERWMESPYFNGAFIWAYCDEAPKRTDQGGKLDSDKSNAPDGILGPRREKEGSYYAIREVWSPIQVEKMRIGKYFDGKFKVKNRFLYTNLADCKMTYKVISCGSPLSIDGATDEKVVASGSVTLPAIAPGETGTASFTLPERFEEGDFLILESYNPQGELLATTSEQIHLTSEYFTNMLSRVPATLAAYRCSAEKDAATVTLKSDRVEVRFNATNGQIEQVTADGKTIPLTNGPVAVGMKMRYDAEASYVRNEPEGAIFCAHYKGAVDSIQWKLTNDGLLFMNAILLNRASGGAGFDDAFMDTEVYNLGLTFSYPEENVTGMKWMGRGPFRVWKNRIPGTNYGVWHKNYNNTITGESYDNLEYPEFKGYHANLYWATLESKKTPFSVYAQNDGIFFRVFTPEEPAGRAGGKRTMPAFPAGDLSFLLDIPAINSFKPIKMQGPQSQPGNIRIKEGDEGLHLDLLFDFRQTK